MIISYINMNLCQGVLVVVLVCLAHSQVPEQFSWDNYNDTSYVP